MRPKTFAAAAASALAAALIVAGCLPYFEEPETETWTSVNVLDHFQAVFHGKGDSSENAFDFNCSGNLAFLSVSNLLTAGRAEISVTVKATNAVVALTEATPGAGPDVKTEIGNALPGVLAVSIKTFDAAGSLSLQLDRWDPAPAERRGMTYACLFPDSYPAVADRTETYHLDNAGGSATLNYDVQTPSPAEVVTITIFDGAAAQVDQLTFSSNQFTGTRIYTGQTQGDWKITVRHQQGGLNGGGCSARFDLR